MQQKEGGGRGKGRTWAFQEAPGIGSEDLWEAPTPEDCVSHGEAEDERLFSPLSAVQRNSLGSHPAARI